MLVAFEQQMLVEAGCDGKGGQRHALCIEDSTGYSDIQETGSTAPPDLRLVADSFRSQDLDSF